MLELAPTPKETTDEIEEQNDSIVMDFVKEKYFHGKMSMENLQELLKNNGDFVVRSCDEENKKDLKERPLSASVKWGSEVHHFPIYFFKAPDGAQATTFEKDNPKIYFHNIKELILHHIKSRTALNKAGIVLINPVERQVQELRRVDVKLESRIGEGAFGTVHSGKYVIDGNEITVAIKITKLNQYTKKVCEEMLSEAKMMAKLQHTNVIHFYGMSMGESDLWIVMELLLGGGLDKFIETNPELSPLERWSFAFDCAKGLNYLHANRILHRDVAARNCLVDLKSGRSIVKLSDFGMSAKGEKYQIESSERTPIKWQAPEVLRTGIFNKACDIWAFGCCVYEIFTGKTPFYETDNRTVRERIIVDPNFRPSLKEFNLIPIAVDIMKLTWKEDPSKRMTMRHYVAMMPIKLQTFIKASRSKNSDTDAKKEPTTALENRSPKEQQPTSRRERKEMEPSPSVRRNTSRKVARVDELKKKARKKESNRVVSKKNAKRRKSSNASEKP